MIFGIINVILALPKIIAGIEGVISFIQKILRNLEFERELKKTKATDEEIKKALSDAKFKVEKLNKLLDI
jgi:hypothetical protein